MATAKLENINKFSKLGLRRRPTYEEIIGLLDENKTITGKLPNRDATFFRNSPEGSFFDGPNYLEELKDEQERLLLRQMNEMLLRRNVRTAGRTFHTGRFRSLPLQSPTIAEAPMQVDAEGIPQPPQQPSQPLPSTRLAQGTRLHAELEQRRTQATKRKEETAMNHRGEVFKQVKPTLAEQMLNIQPPRTVPENIPIFSSGDDDLQPTNVKRKNLNATVPASSSQAPQPMNTTSQPKRGTPETDVEPKGKAGRPKIKYVDLRPDAEKREGDEPEDKTNRKKSKRTNKNKEKIQKRLEAQMAKEATVNIESDDADDEDTRKGSRVRSTIQKPIIPSKVGIQPMYEAFNNARNKNIITKEEFEEFNDIFKEYRKAKGKDKSKYTRQARELYRNKLYNKLKKI